MKIIADTQHEGLFDLRNIVFIGELIKNVPKSLIKKLIIKSTAQMNAVELLQIEESWKNIMKRKQLEAGQKEVVKNVILD